MDKAMQHWSILQKLETDLANKVRSFMVIRKKGKKALVLTESGEAYWIGKMKFGIGEPKQSTEPIRLEVPKLASMAQGHRHILLLDESGQIHFMGENYRGQLGLGNVGKETHFSPKLISIPHKFFTSVRCGGYHSVALTEDGKVWAWGLNDCGQVGVPSSTDFFPSPREISELNRHRVVAVECGSNHSLALTVQGEVYAWGKNDKGQLGDWSKSPSQHTPIQIQTPSPVQSIAAGFGHTLLLTQTGEVYACGDNEFGQLGFRTTTKCRDSLSKVVDLFSISQIASHSATNLSIAMSSEKRCFVWGQLRNEMAIFTPRELPTVYSTVESPLSKFSYHCSTPHSVIIPAIESPCRTELTTQMDICSDLASSKSLRDNRVLNRISQMFDNPNSNPDVRFQVENQFILAHRCVLQTTSDHFCQLFFSCSANPSRSQLSTNASESDINSTPTVPHCPQVTIPIRDHSYPVFYAYLSFLHLGILEVLPEHLVDLFSLSVAYFESDLQQLCLSRMRTTLTTTTFSLYYPLIHRHSLLPELATFQQELVKFASILRIFPNFSK